MKRNSLIAVSLLSIAIFVDSSTAAAFQGSALGTAKTFGVLGGQSVTNTGPTVVSKDLGVWPGTSITGFPPGQVAPPGAMHAADAVAQQAQADVTTAYNVLAGLPCGATLTGQDLGGLTLTTGVYCFTSSAQLTGALVLDAQGDPNALFVFQIASTLTTASNSSVALIHGGEHCNPNVYWQVGSSATLGTNTTFYGNILALTSITLTTGVTVSGRALARNGSVTLDSNTVVIPPQCLCDNLATTTVLGSGCGATLSSSLAVIGQTAIVNIDSNLANAKGLLLGSAPGSPVTIYEGCSAFLGFGSMWVISGFTTNASGDAVLNLPVPDTLLRCADQFVFQAVIVAPGGPLSFGAASNALVVTIGG
jgi:hypothetical protein